MLCKFCNSQMEPMKPGSITNLKSSRACIHSSIAGNTLQVSGQDWECPNCESKVIASVSPNAGMCLTEAPSQLIYSLKKFADRLKAYIYSEDLVNTISVGLSVSELSESRSENIDQLESKYLCHWTHVGDAVNFTHRSGGWNPEDDEPQDFAFFATRHKERGDFLEIEVCRFNTLRIFFDGAAEIEHTNYTRERRFATDKLESGDYSEYSETYSTSRSPVEMPSFTDLRHQLDPLISGTEQIYDVAMAIVEVSCKNEFCSTHELGEDPWRGLTDFIFFESDYLDQEQIEGRMSKNFPVGDMPEFNE